MQETNKGAIVLENIDSALVQDIKTKKLTYYIVTYGCAMNEHDSENIAGILEKLGFIQAKTTDADLVLFNTCCVRENAENRLFGNIGALKQSKLDNKNKMIGVMGCMMQQNGAGENLKKRFPFLDMVFGTHNMHRLPEYIGKALQHKKTLEVFDVDGYILENLPVKRVNNFSAFINIMYGCNNFCTYCIVPFVRGRERSRSSKDIIFEAKSAAQDGVTEITLLGQNVNSFSPVGEDMTFPKLLRELNEIEGLRRIRFLTSHPKDLSDELIFAIADCDKVCPQLHLPVQAGDNEVLRSMNRGYTVEHYKKQVQTIRKHIPGIGITTDIIVGFPGETEEQFQNTLHLIQEVEFDGVFSFMYSLRKGTRAETMEDHLTPEQKSERLQRLIKVQAEINEKKHRQLEGKTFTVLAEKIAKRDGQLTGRSECGKLINFPGKPEEIGSYVDVTIQRGNTNSLYGERN